MRPLPWLLIVIQVIGNGLHSAFLTVAEGNRTEWTLFSAESLLFSHKPQIIMKDLATETASQGINGQSRKDESPPAAPGIDERCGSWRRSIKLCPPVEYKDEMVRFLKLSGPVVRLSSDASQLSQSCSVCSNIQNGCQ